MILLFLLVVTPALRADVRTPCPYVATSAALAGADLASFTKCGVAWIAKLEDEDARNSLTPTDDTALDGILGKLRDRYRGEPDESVLPSVRALLRFYNRHCSPERLHASALFACEFYPFVHGISRKKFTGNDWYDLNGPQYLDLHVLVPEIKCEPSAFGGRVACREAYEEAAKKADALKSPELKKFEDAMGDCRTDDDCIAIANGCGSKKLFGKSSRAHTRFKCECKRSDFVSGCFPQKRLQEHEMDNHKN